MATTRLVQVTQLQIAPSLNTALTVLDTSLTTTMDAIIAAPPAGYEAGSIKILEPGANAVYDGANWNVWTTFTYSTLTP